MAKRRKRKPQERSDEEKFPYGHIRICPFCGNYGSGSGGIWASRWISGPPCCDLDEIHFHMGCQRCRARWVAGAWLKKDGAPDGLGPEPPATA